jgi:hypothetical protein
VHAAPEAPKALNAEAAKSVNEIFRALQGAFPAWRSAFPDDDSLRVAKATWVKGLMAAGVTDLKQIARGVEKARLSESDFFPSVGKFISWCQLEPGDLGMPEPDQAWMEACQHSHHVLAHNWSHPGVYEAGRRAGWFELRNGTATSKSFTEQYQTVVAEVAAGAEFVMPAADATRLEHHRNGRRVQTEQSKAKSRETIRQLRASLGMSR